MGLIKAGAGSLGGTLADQWKEFFYCDALSPEVLAVKGQKRVSGRSSNTKGSDNIISNGSVIAVADGQCMMIVEQGKVVEFCAEPGQFVFDASTEPSIFTGSFGKSLLDTFKTVGRRFTFGGDTGKDQRVYYFNTKEIVDNKFGTATPIPFRVVDRNIGLDIDVSVRCNGVYSYKISDPMLFYTHVCGNVEGDYKRSEIDSMLKTEFISALQPAFARISELEVRPSALPAHAEELSTFMNETLSRKWGELRGRLHCHEPHQPPRGGRRAHQAGTAHGHAARSVHGGCHAHGCTGRGHEDRRREQERRDDGLHGHGHGPAGRRPQCAGALCHGPAAEGCTGCTGCRRLEMQLRRNGDGQLLPELRSKEAAACRKRLDVHLRPEEHRKILLRLRQAAPCRGLDLRLRHGEPGQVLPELRCEEARERAAVPLRQVRLAAGGSAPSAEILPRVRRPL